MSPLQRPLAYLPHGAVPKVTVSSGFLRPSCLVHSLWIARARVSTRVPVLGESLTSLTATRGRCLVTSELFFSPVLKTLETATGATGASNFEYLWNRDLRCPASWLPEVCCPDLSHQLYITLYQLLNSSHSAGSPKCESSQHVEGSLSASASSATRHPKMMRSQQDVKEELLTTMLGLESEVSIIQTYGYV